jgi:hypothetical protein
VVPFHVEVSIVLTLSEYHDSIVCVAASTGEAANMSTNKAGERAERCKLMKAMLMIIPNKMVVADDCIILESFVWYTRQYFRSMMPDGNDRSVEIFQFEDFLFEFFRLPFKNIFYIVNMVLKPVDHIFEGVYDLIQFVVGHSPFGVDSFGKLLI